MDKSQEFIKKVMLGINYNTKKTLSENKIIIFEQDEIPFKYNKYVPGMSFNQYVGDDKKTVNLTSTPIYKSPELLKKEKEELYKKTPRGYAVSLGYNDWKHLQSLFGCPSYKENKEENIKCNLNIKKALEQGWNPNKDVPESLKSSYYDKDKLENKNKSKNPNNTPDVNNYGEPSPSVNEIPGLKNAEFDGDFYSWFNENFVYPEDAEKNSIEGTVNITFTVNSDGSVSNFIVNDSINTVLSDYTIFLFKTMPNWYPAEQDGKKIQSKVTIPVEFSLGNF